MANRRQVFANKQNALQSTGPKSSEGKCVSSRNSLKHGLLSKDLLLREEKRPELEAFRNRVYSTLQPQGELEEVLIERIINAVWRLKRIVRFEVFIFETKDHFTEDGIRKPCQMFYGSTGSAFTMLSRYESMLERSFYKALHELQRLQAMRLGQSVMLPIAIDIGTKAESEIGFVS